MAPCSGPQHALGCRKRCICLVAQDIGEGPASPRRTAQIVMPPSIRRLLVALSSALLLIVAMSTAAFADKRDFNINNNSDYVIAHAYVSAATDPDWGDDILGKDVLNPGEAWQVGFDRG